MRVGIIGAMDEEIQLLKDRIKNCQEQVIANFEFSIGQLENQNIVLLKSGIGKVNAAIATTLLDQHFKCDYIINTGTAAGLHKNIKIGAVVIASELRYYDVDVTSFGYEYGQVPKMPPFYKSDPFLLELAAQSANQITKHQILTGLIVSGDSFLNESVQISLIQEKFPNVLAAEMEACAIAQVCYKFNIPFVIVRSISDLADHKSHLDFMHVAAQNLTKFILVILQKLTRMQHQC